MHTNMQMLISICFNFSRYLLLQLLSSVFLFCSITRCVFNRPFQSTKLPKTSSGFLPVTWQRPVVSWFDPAGSQAQACHRTPWHCPNRITDRCKFEYRQRMRVIGAASAPAEQKILSLRSTWPMSLELVEPGNTTLWRHSESLPNKIRLSWQTRFNQTKV